MFNARVLEDSSTLKLFLLQYSLLKSDISRTLYFLSAHRGNKRFYIQISLYRKHVSPRALSRRAFFIVAQSQLSARPRCPGKAKIGLIPIARSVSLPLSLSAAIFYSKSPHPALLAPATQKIIAAHRRRRRADPSGSPAARLRYNILFNGQFPERSIGRERRK